MLYPHFVVNLKKWIKNGKSYVEFIDVSLFTFVPIVSDNNLLDIILLTDHLKKS